MKRDGCTSIMSAARLLQAAFFASIIAIYGALAVVMLSRGFYAVIVDVWQLWRSRVRGSQPRALRVDSGKLTVSQNGAQPIRDRIAITRAAG